jgi:hypothetical protein
MAPGDTVVLNVGGTLFETVPSTLRKAPMLDRLINTDVGVARDRDENVFVDADPAVFRVVLGYLRTGKLTLRGGVTADEVTTMVDYFCIELPDAREREPEPETDVGRFLRGGAADPLNPDINVITIAERFEYGYGRDNMHLLPLLDLWSTKVHNEHKVSRPYRSLISFDTVQEELIRAGFDVVRSDKSERDINRIARVVERTVTLRRR